MTRRDDSGAIAIVVAISLVVFMGFAALVVDLGHARDVRRQAQNAADASALAAGNELYLGGALTPRITQAVNAAKSYATENFGVPASAWSTCTDPDRLGYVPTSSTECISFDQPVRPVEVRVRIPDSEVPTPFGSVLGTGSVTVAARAKARLEPRVAPRCGLCVLGSGLHNLQNGDATVTGGDIHFNGSVSVSNNGLIATTGQITVESTASGPLANYTPDPTTGQAAITDPLADLSLPPDMTGLVPRTNPCIQGPGIYGGSDLRNALCTLPPGLYVIAGSGSVWDLAGNASTLLAGVGVTLYFTCGTSTVPAPCASTGEPGASLDSSGSGAIAITAPAAGPLKGLGIVYDRGNTSTLRLTGNGSQGMTGTIYLPSGKLQMNGNGCSTSYNALIVVNDIEMNGSPSCLNATYNGSQMAELAPHQLHLDQ